MFGVGKNGAHRTAVLSKELTFSSPFKASHAVSRGPEAVYVRMQMVNTLPVSATITGFALADIRASTLGPAPAPAPPPSGVGQACMQDAAAGVRACMQGVRGGVVTG